MDEANSYSDEGIKASNECDYLTAIERFHRAASLYHELYLKYKAEQKNETKADMLKKISEKCYERAEQCKNKLSEEKYILQQNLDGLQNELIQRQISNENHKIEKEKLREENNALHESIEEMKRQSNREDDCVVCFEPKKDKGSAALTPCGHVCCVQCAEDVCVNRRVCPVCRGATIGNIRVYI